DDLGGHLGRAGVAHLDLDPALLLEPVDQWLDEVLAAAAVDGEGPFTLVTAAGGQPEGEHGHGGQAGKAPAAGVGRRHCALRPGSRGRADILHHTGTQFGKTGMTLFASYRGALVSAAPGPPSAARCRSGAPSGSPTRAACPGTRRRPGCP